jgi:hypothetical protein
MAREEVTIGTLIEIEGNTREVVGITRFSSPVLNWELWDIKPPRGKTRSLVIDMPRAVYDAEKTDDGPEELREMGLRAAQHGEARMEILGGQESDISDCEFTYFRSGDETIALVVEGRQGTETFIGSRIDDGDVDTSPE